MPNKIQYIQNTCDVDGITTCGEIMVLLKDGIPLSYLDCSDGTVELGYVEDLLKPFGIDIEFERLDKVSSTVKRRVNKFLKDAGYE